MIRKQSATNTPDVKQILRDLAYVMHLTRRVKEEMLRELPRHTAHDYIRGHAADETYRTDSDHGPTGSLWAVPA